MAELQLLFKRIILASVRCSKKWRTRATGIGSTCFFVNRLRGPEMNPYQILGIDKAATRDEVDSAFREKAKKYHPDVGGDAWAFRQVQEAYEALIQRTPHTMRASKPSNDGGESEQGQATTSTRANGSTGFYREKPENNRGANDEAARAPPTAAKESSSRAVDPEDALNDSATDLLNVIRYFLENHSIGAALRSKKLSLLDKWCCVLFFIIGLAIAAGSIYSLWVDYGLLSSCETAQGSPTADPKLDFVASGGPLNHSSHAETRVEYSFTVNGRSYKGSDRFSDEEACAMPLYYLGMNSSVGQPITVFYDRRDPSRNRAILPKPHLLWFGVALGLVFCIFPKWTGS